MSKVSHDLYIDVDSSDNILFTKGEDLQLNEWKYLVRWWLDGKPIDDTPEKFSIPLSHFIQNKEWLKFYWHNKGRNFFLTENLKTKLYLIKDETLEFERACRETNSFKKISFENLKLIRDLTEEQYNNICSMLSKSNGANFSVPGAGKTMTTLVIWNYLYVEKRVGKLLVICPKSAFGAWSHEETNEIFENPPYSQILDEQSIVPETEILIINYEKLENVDFFSRIQNWIKKNNSMLVIDEAHRIKGGGKSVRWNLCKKLSNFSSRVELLTGTPMPQGYSDIKNLLSLSWRNLPHNYLTNEKISNLKRGGIFVRTTKSELNLPSINIHEIFVEPGRIQHQIYSALKNNYFGTFKLNNDQEDIFKRKGKAVMTLIAAATNPGLIAGLSLEDAYLNLQWPPKEITSDNDLMKVVENYVQNEMPPKYEWLIKFVSNAKKNNKKVIVWSSFVGNLLTLKNKLLKTFNPSIVYGAIKDRDREDQINRFKNDPSSTVLLTNPQTLGEGISLHKVCHDAVYIDRTYNAGQYLQSIDRIHRLGLNQDIITNIYILETKRTIDNRISDRIKIKVNRMYEMLNDDGLLVPGSMDDEIDDLISFDKDDLSNLLKHLQ